MTDALDRLRAALADRYAIERELGSGGMATVYLAQDLKHERKVAVKIFRPELATALGSERFFREIKITAKLSHPQILPLLDSGEAGGFLYYVMPLVEGDSLRNKLNREKQLSVDEALKITSQVASALSYAHSRDIVHRDIKPENILFQAGEVVVADFGIALAVDSAGGTRLTETGFSLGTPAYMSPEQVSGEREIDGRSDVYSLACVLYEMLAGDPPFVASSPRAVLAKHVTDPVPPITTVRSDVVHLVAAAITKALAKAPAARFDSAKAFSEALFAIEVKTEDGKKSIVRKALSKAPADRFGAAAEFVASFNEQVAAGAVDSKSIAVLPFANLSSAADSDFFSDGITEDVITMLSKIRDLKVISRTSVMQYKGITKPLREIAGELGVASILEGSVRQAGTRVRVSAQLIDAKTDHHLWAETYDRDLTDIFSIQSDVAQHIARALEAQLAPAEKAHLELLPTSDPEAYELYLRGRHYFTNTRGYGEESFKQAVLHYERAIERDPNYADPYAALANVLAFRALFGYEEPAKIFRQAKRAAQSALQLNDKLPEAQSAWGVVSFLLDWDWPTVEQARLRALELNPGSSQVLSDFTTYLVAMRRFEEAIAGAVRARELDPLSTDISANLAWAYFMCRQYKKAVDELDRLESLHADNPFTVTLRTWTYWFMGNADKALDMAQRAVPLLTDSFELLACIGFIYGAAGRTADARDILDRLLACDEHQYVNPIALVYCYTGLSDLDRTFEYLTKSYEDRSPAMVYLAHHADLWFAGISGDPRYRKLLEKMNLLDVAPSLGVGPGNSNR